MKRWVIYFIIGIIIFSPMEGFAKNKNLKSFVFIVVENHLVSFDGGYPFTENGTTYVPLRFFSDHMNTKIQWKKDYKDIILKRNNKKIILDLSTKSLLTKEGHIITDCIFIQDQNMMVPFKFIANYFGYKVSYISEGPIVRVQETNSSLSDEDLLDQMKNTLLKEKQKMIQNIKKREEEENQRRNRYLKNQFKIAYITFDDGPSIYTDEILRILEKHNAKATFFMLSNNIKNYPQRVTKVVNGGHGVGLHGVSHNIKKMYQSSTVLVKEMNECNDSLQRTVGFRTDMVRVPYGSKPYMTPEIKNDVVKKGYKLWDWNVDSKDSIIHRDISFSKIVENIKKQVSKQKVPVILFHERKETVKALPYVLDYLEEENYHLIPIDDNVKPVNFWRE